MIAPEKKNQDMTKAQKTTAVLSLRKESTLV